MKIIAMEKDNPIVKDTTRLEQLEAFATDLARKTTGPAWIYLHGDLGAGKTTFAQFFIHALGYAGRVKSPTYALMEHYPTTPPVVHMDLYRLADAGELHYFGLDDLLAEQPVVLVEWPEKGLGVLPPADVSLFFHMQGGSRQVKVYDPHHKLTLS